MKLLVALQLSLLLLASSGMSRGLTPTLLMKTEAIPAQPGAVAVSWEPGKLVNGSPCLFRVKPDKPLKSLSGQWQGHRVFFDFDAGDGTWYGFAGVELETEAGPQQLTLEYAFANGTRSSSRQAIPIGRGAYRNIALSVPKKFLEPDAETLARIKREQDLKQEVFRQISKDRLWSGEFSAPVSSVTTERFGTRRTFNGKLQSVHQGLDFRAASGTPIRAMNSGQVLLAQELFFEGGFVVVDHGQGLLTMYMHLSEFKVKEGDHLSKGQIIGLSGATGRATGPHLHVAIRWQGVYVDPATMLTLNLPGNR